jgi:hypothetical protein
METLKKPFLGIPLYAWLAGLGAFGVGVYFFLTNKGGATAGASDTSSSGAPVQYPYVIYSGPGGPGPRPQPVPVPGWHLGPSKEPPKVYGGGRGSAQSPPNVSTPSILHLPGAMASPVEVGPDRSVRGA